MKTLVLIGSIGFAILLIAIILIVLLDRKHDTSKLYRAHRKESKRRTLIQESNKDPRIVGEWVSVPKIPQSARIRDIEPRGV